MGGWTTTHWASLVASMGLIMNIIGTLLIYKYGLPDNVSRTGAVLLATEQVVEEEVALARRYDRRSRWGARLLVIGFVVQLIGTWV